MSLQRKLEENDLSKTSKTTIRNELEVKKLQLENNLQHQTRGAVVRSKARWHNEGEKKKKYFLSLKKGTSIMASDKTPGTDGLYKVFWETLKAFYLMH